MAFLQSLAALLVTLSILVTVHEFGHFWVARKCGVRVLRFSVGFGKPLFSWSDKKGTEYAVAAIPLGGYIKMLDEREGDVTANQLPYAFNRQTPGKRIAIASAGPVANFLFAIFAYWLMFMGGFTVVSPVVGSVAPAGLAEQAGIRAGDQVLDVDGKVTNSWGSVAFILLNHIGSSDQIRLKVRHSNDSDSRNVVVHIKNWMKGEARPDPLAALGIIPFFPKVPAVLGEVVPGNRAAQAGLQVGDKIISIDGKQVKDWMSFVNKIKQSPEKKLEFVVLRDNKTLRLRVIPEARKISDTSKASGFIGVRAKAPSWPKDRLRKIQYGPFDAISPALQKTWSDVALTLISIKKMFEGVLSVKNLSGPVTIAKMATDSLASGMETFLRFLAILSVSLGVLNLFPIPVLDGGHILYYVTELIRGKPLSEKIQLTGVKIGVSLIIILMVLAFYNDLSRLM